MEQNDGFCTFKYFQYIFEKYFKQNETISVPILVLSNSIKRFSRYEWWLTTFLILHVESFWIMAIKLKGIENITTTKLKVNVKINLNEVFRTFKSDKTNFRSARPSFGGAGCLGCPSVADCRSPPGQLHQTGNNKSWCARRD